MFSMFDDLFFNWDKSFYNFDRIVHDQAPYKILNKDNKLVIVHNVVGIDQKDIKIDIEQEDDRSFLVISGKTHNDDLNYDYTVNSRFAFNASRVDKINYKMENGLLYIEIKKKGQEKPKISISKIK